MPATCSVCPGKETIEMTANNVARTRAGADLEMGSKIVFNVFFPLSVMDSILGVALTVFFRM